MILFTAIVLIGVLRTIYDSQLLQGDLFSRVIEEGLGTVGHKPPPGPKPPGPPPGNGTPTATPTATPTVTPTATK